MTGDALLHTWLHRGFDGDSRRSLVLCLRVLSEMVPEFDRVEVFVPDLGGPEPRCLVRDGGDDVPDTIRPVVGEGPVHDGLRSRAPIVVPDVAGDGRWPAYAARAADLGLRAQLVVPVQHPTLGTVAVLSLASTTDREISSTAALIGLLCAAQLAARLDPGSTPPESLATPGTSAPGCSTPRRRRRCARPETGLASRCTAGSRDRGLRR